MEIGTYLRRGGEKSEVRSFTPELSDVRRMMLTA